MAKGSPRSPPDLSPSAPPPSSSPPQGSEQTGLSERRDQGPGQAWGQGSGVQLFPLALYSVAQSPAGPPRNSMCCTHIGALLAAREKQAGSAGLWGGTGRRGLGGRPPGNRPPVLHRTLGFAAFPSICWRCRLPHSCQVAACPAGCSA